MRKILICLLWLTSLPGLIQAKPHSHLESVAEHPQTFLAYRLQTADTLRYCVNLVPPKNPLVSAEQVDTLVRVALREWTYGIALRIRQSGREKEFKDIVELLEKPLALEPVTGCAGLATNNSLPSNDTTADIVFLISDKRCQKLRGKATSFYAPAEPGHVPFICVQDTTQANPLRDIPAGEYIPQANSESGRQLLQNRLQVFERIATADYSTEDQQTLWQTNRFFAYDGPTLFATFMHETGHAFGLGDEYLSERPDTYASRQPGEGIMHNLYNSVTCDEINGMITLLDRVAGRERTFQSFCKGRGLLVNGTEK